MRKRSDGYITPIFFVFLLIAVCGSVFAYMLHQTTYKENVFTPASVSCEVHEKTNSSVSEKTSINVENTGNIDAYLRLKIISYWVQEKDGNTQIAAKASTVPEFTLAEGWLKGSDSIYYYRRPVSPGDATGELLASKIVLAEEDGFLQVIEVFAEAIQSKPDSSVTSSWSVVLDDSGNIISVP